MMAFDQSEHDSRIWDQGTAALKACLPAPLPFPPPRIPLGSLGSPIYFLFHPVFAFFPIEEPGPRLKIKGELRAILWLRWTVLKTS